MTVRTRVEKLARQVGEGRCYVCARVPMFVYLDGPDDGAELPPCGRCGNVPLQVAFVYTYARGVAVDV